MKRNNLETAKRNRVPIILILLVIGCAFLMPAEARAGLLGLFSTKTMGISLGVLIAHYTRFYLFPYLDMSKLLEEHHWAGVVFLTVWYGVIIWAFSMGG